MKRYYLLFLVLTSFTGCFEMPSDINPPQWNTELNLPLTNREYTLSELIKTDEYISIDSTGGKYLYQAKHSDMGDKDGIEEFLEGKLDQKQTNITIPMTNGEGFIGAKLAQGLAIDTAYFIRGTLTITVKNNSSSDMDISMILPAFVKNSQTLTKTGNVPANDTKVLTEELLDYSYSYKRQKFGPDTLQINGSIAGNDFNGNIIVDYEISNTMFRYIAGKIPPKQVDAIESTTGLPVTDDVIDLRDKTSYHDAQITLKGFYFDRLPQGDLNEPFDMSIDTLYVMGVRNKKTEIKYLKLNSNPNNNLGPALMENGKFEQVYNTQNSNLSDFLSFIPDSIIVYARPTVNPEGKKGAATNTDEVQFGYDLLIRSSITIKDLLVKDTTDLNIGGAQESMNDFRAATIYFKIDNGVAFGGKVVMAFLDSTIKPWTNLFTLDTVNFEAADINGEGYPIVKHSEPTVMLDSMQLQQLSKANKIIMNVLINSTDSQNNSPVMLTSKDWLHIISFCKVSYHINPGSEDSTSTK